MPMVAALSAAHLGAILFPDTLRRLYIVRDNDQAGDGAMTGLDRTGAGGRDRGDGAVAAAWRLQRGSASLGIDALRAALRIQLAPEDVARFLSTSGLDRNKG